ncbi:MAG: gamma-glutamyl-gamma-aminobutyrate hydrolase family protein [Victivallales bacterium]|nr:gamma-glutamyl-gamma-aminobutyrate hydrolase family protein [Victivallales bacterium]MCF7888730.1 gamma-glutamyl-gamma-aminobutyrate hydrolase family protein [Victivallales bacterium]
MKTIYTLVVTDRLNMSMQPELYYAFRTTAKKIYDNQINFRFSIFNPFMADDIEPVEWSKVQQDIAELLNYVTGYIVDIKRTTRRKSLFNAVLNHINKNPDYSLGRLYRKLEKIMDNFSYLIIESTGKTVIHPIFYNRDIKSVEVGFATNDDIKDTIYGMMLLDIALKQEKPVFGTCHGAQLGYLHAGGGLKRIFDNIQTPEEGAYYPRRNPHGGPREIWQIDRMLNTRDLNDFYKYSLVKYPLPAIFRRPEDKDTERYINRDFNHTLAMTTPVPKTIEVISYHPLSSFNKIKDKDVEDKVEDYPQVTKESIDKFKSSIKINTIVDIFKYKTLIAFQHHPHYTYDDVDNVAIFEYLLKDICKHLKIKPKRVNKGE